MAKIRSSKKLEKALLELEAAWRDWSNWYTRLTEEEIFLFQLEDVSENDIKRLVSFVGKKPHLYMVAPWVSEPPFVLKGEINDILFTLKRLLPNKDEIRGELQSKKQSLLLEIKEIEKELKKIDK